MLGVQVASALRDLYGRNGAETISGLVRHARGARRSRPRHRPVVGRQPRPERGRGGRPRAYSYGANTIRDGVSLERRAASSARSRFPPRSCACQTCTAISSFPDPCPSPRFGSRYVERPAVGCRAVRRRARARRRSRRMEWRRAARCAAPAPRTVPSAPIGGGLDRTGRALPARRGAASRTSGAGRARNGSRHGRAAVRSRRRTKALGMGRTGRGWTGNDEIRPSRPGTSRSLPAERVRGSGRIRVPARRQPLPEPSRVAGDWG